MIVNVKNTNWVCLICIKIRKEKKKNRENTWKSCWEVGKKKQGIKTEGGGGGGGAWERFTGVNKVTF